MPQAIRGGTYCDICCREVRHGEWAYPATLPGSHGVPRFTWVCLGCARALRRDYGVHVCSSCGTRYIGYALVATPAPGDEGRTVCPHCAPERCENCHWPAEYRVGVVIDFVHGLPSTQLWCDTCARAYAQRCAQCGTHYEGTTFWHIGCPQCFREERGRAPESCPRCNRYAGGLREPWRLCSSCVDAISCVQSYGSSPPGGWHRYIVRVGSGVLLGAELETDRYPDDVDTDDVASDAVALGFWPKRDGSLDYGVELVSPPATWMAHRRGYVRWADLVEMVRRYGGASHDAGTCGLHVHIGRDTLSHDDVAKIAAFVHRHHDRLRRIARRSSNSYARYCPDMTVDRLRSIASWGSDCRYEAVNVKNATVEVRIFRGTLKLETLLARIGLCDAIAAFVQCHGWPLILSGRCWKAFCMFVERHHEYDVVAAYMRHRGVMVTT